MPAQLTIGDPWRPNPGPQEAFLRCGAFEALYGGAAGGGKSEALLAGALRLVGEPSYRALLLRRTFPELKRSLIERTLAAGVYRGLGGSYHSTDHFWRFPSGAVIEFGSLEHEHDVHRYQSAEYQYVGFDELTSFLESQFVYLSSRLRSSRGLPLRLRGGSNPGGEGHEWVLRRYAPWLHRKRSDAYEGPLATAGERLWYRHDDERDEEVLCDRSWWLPTCASCRPGVACPAHAPRARAFFPATVADNPYLAGTSYEAVLDGLQSLDRKRLKGGDWLARAGKGEFFKRPWFVVVDEPPGKVVARVRYWDRAATEGGGDWTVGVRMSRTEDGLFWVEHVRRGQWGPARVEDEIRATATTDPEGTRLVLERDPAQAGKFEAEHYLREFAAFDIHLVPPQGDKVTRAKPVSAQAEHGRVRLVRGTWNDPYLDVLEDFPAGKKDDVDATSGAYRQCLVLCGAEPQVAGARQTISLGAAVGGKRRLRGAW